MKATCTIKCAARFKNLWKKLLRKLANDPYVAEWRGKHDNVERYYNSSRRFYMNFNAYSGQTASTATAFYERSGGIDHDNWSILIGVSSERA